MARPVTISPVNFALIRHTMKQQSVLAADLAEQLGISASYLSEMLNGHSLLNDEKLNRIADILSVPPYYFRTSIGRMAMQSERFAYTDRFSRAEGTCRSPNVNVSPSPAALNPNDLNSACLSSSSIESVPRHSAAPRSAPQSIAA